MRSLRYVFLILGLGSATGLGAQTPTLNPFTSPAVSISGVSSVRELVEILTDRWGVAHIYAKNEHDLFFAQGYNAAKDRLFQFELWRQQATGTVADMLGRRELERDIGSRLHMF